MTSWAQICAAALLLMAGPALVVLLAMAVVAHG